MNIHAVPGFITPNAPFVFSQTLRFVERFSPRQAETGLTAHSLARAIWVQGRLVVIGVNSTGTIEAPQLNYSLFAAGLIDAGVQAATAERLSFYLSIYDDL